MDYKIFVCLGLLSASMTLHGRGPKIEDLAAYKAGLKTADIMLKQWIYLAKKDKEGSLQLMQEFKGNEEYILEANKSFLQGAMDGLKNKSILSIAQSHNLDKVACVFVLCCFHFWQDFVEKAASSGHFDDDLDESKEYEILRKAAKEVYGKDTPELVAFLKKELNAYEPADTDEAQDA